MSIKWLIIVLILAIIIYIFWPTKSSYQGPITDHFNGKLFYNNPPGRQKSLLDILKWRLTSQKKTWPETVANKPYPKVSKVSAKGEIKATFINHSTVLIQTASANFLTDPIWSERASPFTFIGPKRVHQPGIAFDDLPPIDFVMISHNHYDHLDKTTLVKLNEKFKPIFFVPLGDKKLLEKFGIKNVIELDWWQQYTFKHIVITFLPTRHWSARSLNDKCKTLWGSYGIEIENKYIYFAGDTAYSGHFKEISSKWHKPDLSFLPIGAYQPEWFMQDNHMNPEEAVRAHRDLQTPLSVAIHFGTFQLSDEAIDQPVIDLNTAKHKYTFLNNSFRVLEVGEPLVLH